MNDEQLYRLESLHAAATPGPYHAINAPSCVCIGDETVQVASLEEFMASMHIEVFGNNAENDGIYIVAACNAVPELVREVRKLKKRLSIAEQALVKTCEWWGAIEDYDKTCPACEQIDGHHPSCPYPKVLFWDETVIRQEAKK